METIDVMDKPPLISFIVPVLNDTEQALKTVTLISKLEGSDNVEVIVVDDGSKLPISFSITNTTFKWSIIRLEKNSGRSTAINIGARESSGHYVSFLDVDCEPERNYITRLKTLISEGNDVVFGHINFINIDAFFEGFEADVQAKRKGCGDNWELELTSACLTLSREYFDKVGGFSKDFKRYGFEDRDFLIRLKKEYPYLKKTYCQELMVNHIDNTNLSSYLNKFYASGRHSSVVFRMKHPEAYNKMNYAKVDINTSKILSHFPLFFIRLILFLSVVPLRLVFNTLSSTSSLKNNVFKLLKGMFYLKGTIDQKETIND